MRIQVAKDTGAEDTGAEDTGAEGIGSGLSQSNFPTVSSAARLPASGLKIRTNLKPTHMHTALYKST